MKCWPRPIDRLLNKTVPHRVQVDVVSMASKIEIIPDRVLPKPILPNAPTPPRTLGGGHIGPRPARCEPTFCEITFDRPKSPRKIHTFRRQSHKHVKVLGHQDHGIDLKSMKRPGFFNGLVQPSSGIAFSKEFLASIGDHREKETTTCNLRATVIRHGKTPVESKPRRAGMPALLMVSSFRLQPSPSPRHSSSCSRLTSSPLSMSWASARICGMCSAKGLLARHSPRSCLSSSPARWPGNQ